MKINLNNEISVYRGETAAIDFKISQRQDYYVPFLISDQRVNPMVCITIGSARRESKNIVTKQLWLDLDSMEVPRFTQTVVEDLGTLSSEAEDTIQILMLEGIMYQFLREAEVAAGTQTYHYAYLNSSDVVVIDDYDFIVIMAIDETITLDMTNTDYFYQIELMDSEPMIPHIQALFTANPSLINRLPNAFTNTEEGIAAYLPECIAVINTAFPNHWGYKVIDPLTCPVAKVSNIQMLQTPKRFIVQSVVK